MTNIDSVSTLATLYPNFVLHKRWDVGREFNDRLYEIALEDNLKSRAVKPGDDGYVCTDKNHLKINRHNILLENQHEPVIRQLVGMADAAIREYLMTAYGYNHTGQILMQGEALYQRRKHNELPGVVAHTHSKHELVCTYYTRFTLDEDAPESSLHRGAVRFYDPANVGKRLWPKLNQNDGYIGGWYNIDIDEGSMLVFEGHMPHDAAYFTGEERMCIPIMCDLVLPNSFSKVSSEKLMRGEV